MVCDGYIEELRRRMKCEKIGTYISECNTRNENLLVSKVQGVESSGNFAETRANTNGIDFHNYKIVKPNQFAYNPSRINLGSIALRNEIMDVDMIFKIAAIGIIVAILNQLLVRSGREEQALLTTIAGLVVALMMIISQISELFSTVKSTFGL